MRLPRYFFMTFILSCFLTPSIYGIELDVGQRFRSLISRFLPDGYQLDWKKGEIDLSFSKLSFSGVGFCIYENAKKKNQACFEKLNLDLKLSKFDIVPEGSSIEAGGGRVIWHLTADSKKADATGSKDVFGQLKVLLGQLTFFRKLNLNIELSQIDFSGEQEAYQLNGVTIENRLTHLVEQFPKVGLDISSVHFDIKSFFSKNGELSSKKVHAEISIDDETVRLTGKTIVDMKGRQSLNIDFEMPRFNIKSGRSIQAFGKLRTQLEKIFVEAKVDGRISEGEIKGNLNTQLKNLSQGGFDEIVLPCQFGFGEKEKEKVSCQVRGDVTEFIDLDTENSEKKIPFSSKIQCEDRICEVKANLSEGIKIDGRIDVSNLNQPKGDAKVLINDFKIINRTLKKFDVGMPAPLASFSGKVNITASFSGSANQGWNIPLKLETDLDSKNQKVDLSLELKKIKVDKELRNLEGRLLIRSASLILPKFKLGGFPSLNEDSRIRGAQQRMEGEGVTSDQDGGNKEPKDSKMRYSFNIETVEKGAVKIKTERLEKPLSLSSRISIKNDQPLKGWVAIEETDIEVLNREASIQSLRLDFAREFAKSSLDGLIRARQNLYQIRILIKGTVEDPIVRLESDPFLSESEIVSLMLYGQVSSGVSGEDGVADAKAEIASRSVGLASIYLFSGTPIESIQYNSVEESVTANFSVGDNRLSVTEQNSSLKKVGVERRLHKNIFLRSSRNFGEDTSTTTTLEWENRY